MSTINAIMAELQAGEAAKARVPELTKMIDELSAKLNESQRHAQALELRAKERETTIEGLNQKVSSLVVERDDASFRELEAQDRFTTLLESVRPIWSSLGHALNRADPPKPVPEPVKVAPTQPEPSPFQPPGQSEGGPTAQAENTSAPSTPSLVQTPAQTSNVEQTGSAGSNPEPWTPKVEMPEVKHDKVEDDSDYRPFAPWQPRS